MGHYSNECQKPKKNGQGNVVERNILSKWVQDMNMSMVVFEYNNVGNPREWWVDIGATHQIFADKTIFSKYKKLNGE